MNRLISVYAGCAELHSSVCTAAQLLLPSNDTLQCGGAEQRWLRIDRQIESSDFTLFGGRGKVEQRFAVVFLDAVPADVERT